MLVATPGRNKTPIGNRILRRRVEALETRRGFNLDALGMAGGGNKDTQHHQTLFATLTRSRWVTGRRIFQVAGIERRRHKLRRPGSSAA